MQIQAMLLSPLLTQQRTNGTMPLEITRKNSTITKKNAAADVIGEELYLKTAWLDFPYFHDAKV